MQQVSKLQNLTSLSLLFVTLGCAAIAYVNSIYGPIIYLFEATSPARAAAYFTAGSMVFSLLLAVILFTKKQIQPKYLKLVFLFCMAACVLGFLLAQLIGLFWTSPCWFSWRLMSRSNPEHTIGEVQ